MAGPDLSAVWEDVTEAGRRARYTAGFLTDIEPRNLRMLPNAARHMAGPGLRDWRYNERLVREELPKAVKNLVLSPEDMNEFQEASPVDGYVSTPDDGLVAGFAKNGRMCSLLYPRTGFTHQVPYYVTGDGMLDGSKPREGGFLGVLRDEEVTWQWEGGFDHGMRFRDGTGILRMEHDADDLGIGTDAYVPPGTNSLVQDVTVENHGTEPVDALVYYLQANANDDRQYILWNSHRNHATADDTVTWRDADSDIALELSGDAPVVGSGVADAPLEDLFQVATAETTGRYVGGFLTFDVPIDPGETGELSVLLSGSHSDAPDATTGLRSAAADYWREELAPVTEADIDEAFAEQYATSTIAVMNLYDPASGSISAAPNLVPSYFPSWPRDSGFSAVSLAWAGKEELAKDHLARFLPKVQEEDGSFKQCYDSREESAGVIEVENDQQPIYAWATWEVFRVDRDEAFLEQAWPAVENALDYTVDAVTDDGLLSLRDGLLNATPDYAEMPSDARKSLWTNAWAYRGLLDGARMAEVLGEDPAPYADAAQRIGDAIEDRYFDAAPRDSIYTNYTISGGQANTNPMFVAAIYPTRWTEEYGHEQDILDLVSVEYEDDDGYWLPREFLYTAALYHLDRHSKADPLLNEFMDETLPAGTLAEQVSPDGDHDFAALGWSNSKFKIANHVRQDLYPDD